MSTVVAGVVPLDQGPGIDLSLIVLVIACAVAAVVADGQLRRRQGQP